MALLARERARRRTPRAPRRPAAGRSRGRRGRARCRRRARRPGGPCRCRARRRRGCRGTCTPRPRRPRPSRRRSPRARPRPPARPRPRGGRRPGSRPARSSSVPRSTGSWPSAASVSSTNVLEREARMVERAGDPHEPLSLLCWLYSCAAISAAPSTPARGPWRASRIFVFVAHARAARAGTRAVRAGSSSRSPARRDAAADHDLQRVEEVDRVGDADAEPLAEDPQARAARPRRPPWRRRRTSWPGDLAVGRQALAEERVRVARGRRRAPAGRAPAGGERLERAGLREVRARAGRRRRTRSQPDDRVADLGAALVAPR